jgi:hypothetical protein
MGMVERPQHDAQTAKCPNCDARTSVKPPDLIYDQELECEGCGNFWRPSAEELIEFLLRWVNDMGES